MKRYITSLLLYFVLSLPTVAQELNCTVTVDDQFLEGNSFDYLKQSLTNDIQGYINNYNWTEIAFEEKERIECQFNIVIRQGDENFNFVAETIISARRPIYNTMSQTSTVIINDASWQFSYPQGRSLIHDEMQFEALTGFIDYYCYLILGIDFDTFSPLGGTTYLNKAQDVVDLAQTASAFGWNRNTNNLRNRFVLINELSNSSYEDFRRALYLYHRQGLDTFTRNPRESRENVTEALSVMLDAKRRNTNNYLFDIFFDTKYREVIAIYEGGAPQIRLKAFNILRELDQAHLSDYEVLQN